MIVVAILAVLASVGVPLMADYQVRAKFSEAPLNVASIADAAYLHLVEHPTEFPEGSANPSGAPGKELRPWVRGLAGWTDIGFEPDGDLRCTYGFSGGSSGASCDLDGDLEVRGTGKTYAACVGGMGGGYTSCTPGAPGLIALDTCFSAPVGPDGDVNVGVMDPANPCW